MKTIMNNIGYENIWITYVKSDINFFPMTRIIPTQWFCEILCFPQFDSSMMRDLVVNDNGRNKPGH